MVREVIIMPAELRITTDTDIKYYQSSNLQGIMMKQISGGYADYLHSLRYNPYSISVEKIDGRMQWCIKTLDDEAYDNIIEPLLDNSFQHFIIYNGNIDVHIKDKNVICKSFNDINDELPSGNTLRIRIATPMAFKSDGRYICMPELDLIYQSLINKYNAVCKVESSDASRLIEALSSATNILKYDIHSEKFPLERQRISGCVGEMIVSINADEELTKLAKYLLYFGEFSGIGIKCSMGMGAIRII